MTETPQADALLTDLISGDPQFEAFADLTNEHEREKALHVLLALLTDPNPILREHATKALGALGDRRAVQPLIHSIQSISPALDGLRQRALEMIFESLLALSSPRELLAHLVCIPGALNTLQSRLRRFDQEDLLPILGEVVSYLDESGRRAAVSILGGIDDPRCIRLLIARLDDKTPDIRRSNARWLMQMGVIEAMPFLLAHPDYGIRQSFARHLGNMDDVQELTSLYALLEDRYLAVSLEAAVALGKQHRLEGLDVIYRYVRGDLLAHSVDALGQPLKRHDIPSLWHLDDLADGILAWPSGGEIALIMIAEIFGQKDDSLRQPTLEKLLQYQDGFVRAAAQQAKDAIRRRYMKFFSGLSGER